MQLLKMSRHHTLAIAAITQLLTCNVEATPVSGQGTWETTLQARDLDGDNLTDAFYDTVLNITWLRDASVKSERAWFGQDAWAARLTFGGYTDWRLPETSQMGIDLGCGDIQDFTFSSSCGFDVSPDTSEMAHLFFVTLGNKSRYAKDNPNVEQPGYGLVNTGNFEDFRSGLYGSYTVASYGQYNYVWSFDTSAGLQSVLTENLDYFGLAVRNGDVRVSEVPEPSPLSLTTLGVCALMLGRRRRQKQR